MLSVSGLRGIAGSELTRDLVASFTQAFVAFNKARTLVLGRDTRPSSTGLQRIIIEALKPSGCRIINLDITPTPTVLFIVRKIKADAGIMITASHNPIEYNGLKFINKKGEFLNDPAMEEFIEFIKKPVMAFSTHLASSTVAFSHSVEKHIDEIMKVIRPAAVRLRVAVDAVAGAGSHAMPMLLESMGCTVHRLNCEYRSGFPRPPEPIPENITDLCAMVKREKCDIGFAVDPDCDRLSVIDDRGSAIGEENTLVLATDFILSRKRGPVVTNLSTTALMDYVAHRHKCRLYRTRVGEANVVEKMKKVRAVIGGEGNGGVIYPRINMTRDALVGSALILNLIAEKKESLSKIMNQYPKFCIFKEKIEITKERFESKISAIIKTFKGKVIKTDGLRITKHEFWVHVRPSNTEPLVRIIAEARDKRTAKEIIRTIKRILRK